MEDCWRTVGEGPPWYYLCEACADWRDEVLDGNSYSWNCPRCGGTPALYGVAAFAEWLKARER